MILTLAVILGLIASILRHRSRAAGQIAALPLRALWLALIALALQLPLLRAPFSPAQQAAAAQAAFLLSHLLLLAFVWLNRRLAGIQIVGLGMLCNLAVILANGGFMPITPEALVRINPGSGLEQWTLGYHYGSSKDIILLRADTALWVLSDILVLPPPFPWPAAFSLGDLWIAVGIIVLLQGPLSRPEPVPAPGQEGHPSSQSNRHPAGLLSKHPKEVRIDGSQES